MKPLLIASSLFGPASLHYAVYNVDRLAHNIALVLRSLAFLLVLLILLFPLTVFVLLSPAGYES